MDDLDDMDERQRREFEYHREFAARHRDKSETPVDLDVVTPGPQPTSPPISSPSRAPAPNAWELPRFISTSCRQSG
jgi:hypothetical protein